MLKCSSVEVLKLGKQTGKYRSVEMFKLGNGKVLGCVSVEVFKLEIFMAKIETFEELECWKAARALVKDVYQLTSKGSFAKDYGL